MCGLKHTPVNGKNIYPILSQDFSYTTWQQSCNLTNTKCEHKHAHDLFIKLYLYAHKLTHTHSPYQRKNVQTFIIFDTSFRQVQIVNTIIQIE